MARPAEVFQALRQAHAKADADAAAALYAPDAVYYEPDNVAHRGPPPDPLPPWVRRKQDHGQIQLPVGGHANQQCCVLPSQRLGPCSSVDLLPH